MIDLINEIRKAYNGDPWHGQNVTYLLTTANPDKVFAHPVPGAHSIAELVAHLTAWTEEVAERLTGKKAKEPTRGDWPVIQSIDHTTWNVIFDDFMVANEKLIAICESLNEQDWNAPVIDERNPPLGAGVTNEELLNGLVQHHAYHAGQIALLLKF